MSMKTINWCAKKIQNNKKGARSRPRKAFVTHFKALLNCLKRSFNLQNLT